MSTSKKAQPPVLVSFPPALQPIPCKPLLFDLAFDNVGEYDLSSLGGKQEETGERKGLVGVLAGLWGSR
jgi:signal recognition particle subunit SRP68